MENFENLFDEKIIRMNVEFAAMFILNFECLKDYIVNQLKEFLGEEHFEGDEIKYTESARYKERVRSLDKNIENASLKCFIKMDAITEDDYDLYQKCRKRRNEITHNLLKNLNQGFDAEDARLFNGMLQLYSKLDKWWINEVEIPISGDDIPDDYDRNQVFGGQAFILDAINDIILRDGASDYSKILEAIKRMQKENQDG